MPLRVFLLYTTLIIQKYRPTAHVYPIVAPAVEPYIALATIEWKEIKEKKSKIYNAVVCVCNYIDFHTRTQFPLHTIRVNPFIYSIIFYSKKEKEC